MKTIETPKTLEFNGLDLILDLDNGKQLHIVANEEQVNADKDLFIMQINLALTLCMGEIQDFENHMRINGFDVTYIEML